MAANNSVEKIETSSTSLDELTTPYGLILANIIHNTLVEMAPSLTRLLSSGGILIMAGILKGEQAENITEIYCKNGLLKQKERSSGEWSALSFRKP
ncbi:MAG: 50S ribosomal protein L11 methyltransferase [Desulfobulbaceae bacterium]|nr:50S ribosomal protein L11 methyltransferase [Desulfobulbaceae bacterium]